MLLCPSRRGGLSGLTRNEKLERAVFRRKYGSSAFPSQGLAAQILESGFSFQFFYSVPLKSVQSPSCGNMGKSHGVFKISPIGGRGRGKAMLESTGIMPEGRVGDETAWQAEMMPKLSRLVT